MMILRLLSAGVIFLQKFFPLGIGEGDFLKLNIVQKQGDEFVQSYKNKKVSLLGFVFSLSQWG